MFMRKELVSERIPLSLLVSFAFLSIFFTLLNHHTPHVFLVLTATLSLYIFIY
jgi:heme/copper-type cytochrome/quinol oxidase subunit 3